MTSHDHPEHGWWKELHLWVALIVLSLYLVCEFTDIGHKYLPQIEAKQVLGCCVVMMVFLVGSDLSASRKQRLIERSVNSIESSIGATLENIEAYVQTQNRAALCKRPVKIAEYRSLWGSFTGDYSALNPSFRIEGGIKSEDVVDFFVERYKDNRISRARYLFFVTTAGDLEDVKTFKKYMASVKEKLKRTRLQELEVRVNTTVASGLVAESYVGTRLGQPTAIVELMDRSLGNEHGSPHYYMVVNEPSIAAKVEDHFNREWMSTSSQNIDLFSPDFDNLLQGMISTRQP